MDLSRKPKEKGLISGLGTMYRMAKASFFLLGVASIALVPYSLDLFLSLRRRWIISHLIILVVFVLWKLFSSTAKNSSTTTGEDHRHDDNINVRDDQFNLSPLHGILPETWYDVLSSPTSDQYSCYDVPYSFPTTNYSSGPVEAEPLPPEVEKEMIDPFDDDEHKIMMDGETWNNIVVPPSLPTSTTAARIVPRETEPFPPEVIKKEVEDPFDDQKSMDDTWNAIVGEGRRAMAKSTTVLLRRQNRRHDQEQQQQQQQEGPIKKPAETMAAKKGGLIKKLEMLAKKKKKEEEEEVEAAPALVVKEDQAGWRRREVLVVAQEDLFERVETFIKKHYDHLRLQRQESERRRFFELERLPCSC